jgi:hypothetical protein
VLMRLIDSTGESCAGGRGGGDCRSGTVRLRADSVIELGGTKMGQHLCWRRPGGAQVRPAKGESAALGLSVGHCCAREERRENFFLCVTREERKKNKRRGTGKGMLSPGERERERERKERQKVREKF